MTKNGPRPGDRNLITDVDGISVGNATDEKAQSGVTVLRCAGAFIAAVDVRGGAPGTRETEVLACENLVGRADAFVLTGGSVFGLAAADGAASALSADGIGLRLNGKGPAVPIIPAAVLYDLANGGDKTWGETPPYRALGATAVRSASADFKLGSVGAGRGAMAGTVKGGLGSASLMLDEGFVVGALVAANPVGSVFAADGKSFLAWPYELNDEFGGLAPPAVREKADPFPGLSRLNQPTRPSRSSLRMPISPASKQNAWRSWRRMESPAPSARPIPLLMVTLYSQWRLPPARSRRSRRAGTRLLRDLALRRPIV